MAAWSTSTEPNLVPPSLDLGDGVLTTLTCPNSLRTHFLSHGYSPSDFKDVKTLALTCEGSVKVVLFLPDGKQYALKQYMKEKLSKLRNFQARREIQLHSNFCHPAILPMYAAWEDDKTLCLLMEYLPAGDLYKHLQSRPLHESIAVPRVVGPMLEALEYLHSRHVIHRDLKLENVFVTETAIKVADFGLSMDVTEERPVTRLGTLPYMSLEILAGVLKNDPREFKERKDLEYDMGADVWALGVLVYEVLIGTLPFKGQNQVELVESIQKGIVFPHFVTDEAVDFLLCALTLDPLTRPTARQLLRHPWVTRYYTPTDSRTAASEMVPATRATGSMRAHSSFYASRSQASAFVVNNKQGSQFIPGANSHNRKGKGLNTTEPNRGPAVRRVPPALLAPTASNGPDPYDASIDGPEIADAAEDVPSKKSFLKVLTGLFIWKKKSNKKNGKAVRSHAQPAVSRAARSTDPDGYRPVQTRLNDQHAVPEPPVHQQPHSAYPALMLSTPTRAQNNSIGPSRASHVVSIAHVDVGGRHGSSVAPGSSRPQPVEGGAFYVDPHSRPRVALVHAKSYHPSPMRTDDSLGQASTNRHSDFVASPFAREPAASEVRVNASRLPALDGNGTPKVGNGREARSPLAPHITVQAQPSRGASPPSLAQQARSRGNSVIKPELQPT